MKTPSKKGEAEMSMFDEIVEMIEKVERMLFDEHICAVVDTCGTLPVLKVEIQWGDWKHDHLRAKYLITKNFPLEHFDSKTTESDGSDCYSAIHYFVKR